MRNRDVLRSTLPRIVTLALLSTLVRGQVPNNLAVTATNTRPTASIAGTVRDENGAAVLSVVTISTQGFEQRALTQFNGTFQFSNLRGGKYILCAQPQPFLQRPTDDPFLDSCLWHDSSTPLIAVGTGQARANVVLPVQHGHLLKVRVNDPARVLPATANGRAAGNEIAIHVKGPSGLAQPVPVVSQDAQGRNHAIVIAFNSPHTVVVHSSAAFLKDAGGADLDETRPVAVNVARGTNPAADVTVNVNGRKP